MAVPGSSADEASPGTTLPLLKAILEQTIRTKQCVNKEEPIKSTRAIPVLEKAETLSDNQHPILKLLSAQFRRLNGVLGIARERAEHVGNCPGSSRV